MNASIIRRFARYHGINIVANDGAMADLGYFIEELSGKLHGNFETESLAKAAQSLTRIEDAEALCDDAEGLTMRLGAMFITDDEHGSEVLRAAANRLLVKAGIDPDKWREVEE